jgi:hypothetical protein
MEHFSTAAWIDFARETGSSDRLAEIQQHLDRGCSSCSKSLELWRRAVDITSLESRFAPPADAVRAVNDSFALHKVVSFQGSNYELANLVFDNALQPVAAGVRGSTAVVRQLLYRSGSVCIDMRMQPKPGSDAVVLMGQLMDSSKPNHGIGGIPVSLLSQGATVSRHRTNNVGEFDFGISALNHVQLVFGMADNRTIIVPVPDGKSGQGLSSDMPKVTP